MSHVHVFPMHTHYLFHIFDIFELFGTFLIVLLFFLPLNLFTLVVSVAPKRKSTPAQNPLRFGASSSTDPSPSNVRFRDDDSIKAFSENFSKRGIHSER